MSISVFIADDHAVVRDGLRALLAANPALTVVGDAADGESAVAQAASLEPDIVIMDINMPGLGGIAATQAIRAAAAKTRVVILSMLSTPEHVIHALQAGASGYLLKESAGREVLEAVLVVAAGHYHFSRPVLDGLVADCLAHHPIEAPRISLDTLSAREREVLQQVVQGRTSAEIAEALFLSPKTVESYRSRLMRKLSVSDIPSLVKVALQAGL
jgi:DNA-binding NarL/FixJ family response regulator